MEYRVLVMIFMLLIYTGFEALKHKRKLAIGHETAVVILIGSVFSLFMADGSSKQSGDPIFNELVFFYICLPVLLFTIGFSMQHRHFFRNVKRIMIFGVVGTFVQFIVTTVLSYIWIDIMRGGYVIQWDPKTQQHSQLTMTWSQIMIMNSLLCASDEIAAQTSLDPTKKRPKILDFISGQSVINDAVSIILFTTVTKQLASPTSHTGSDLLDSSIMFFTNIFVEGFVAIMIGIAFAFACTYILKKMRSLSKSPVGCALIFCFGLLSYLTAEINNRSGIIAILTCSMIMANYAWFNLSP
jgi:NhaP-type Na+/H+ or K+/H+ antiporter